MRLWPWARVNAEPARELAGFTLDQCLNRWSFDSLQDGGGFLDAIAGFSHRHVSRRDALKATAILRARNLIAGVPATLPLELRDRRTRELDDRNWLGTQPHPRLESTVMFAFTFEDLLFESTSYWRITRRSEGFPIEAEHLDHRAVSQHSTFGMPSQVLSEDLPFASGDPIFVDGIPLADGLEVIRFTSPNPPLLTYAAPAIRTVLLLDQIAGDYATDPLPFGYFQDDPDANVEDTLDDDEVNEVIAKWEFARKHHRWGYVETGLKLNPLEWPSPRELQLVEARNHAVLELARATGLDPSDMAVNLEGTSRTYQNSVERRLDLVDFVLMPYIKAVEDRLSMGDVTARGLRAQFDIGAFARADFKTRMEGYELAIAKAGVMEVNEARKREGWPDIKAKPAPMMPPQLQSGQPTQLAPGQNGQNGNGREPVEVT